MARIEVKARLDLPPGVEVLGYERCGDPPAKDQVIIDYLNTHCDSHCDVADFPFHFGPARSPGDHCPGAVSKRQDWPPLIVWLIAAWLSRAALGKQSNDFPRPSRGIRHGSCFPVPRRCKRGTN